MIKKSGRDHIEDIVKIYNKIIDDETIRAITNWEKDVYPSKHTAVNAHENGELFVMEIDGQIVASAIINQKQLDEYDDCKWKFHARSSEIMVIHTLAVDPEHSGKGYASAFMSFYESYAWDNGCTVLRLDTNVKNLPARQLYKKLGYIEAGTVYCNFNGIDSVSLVCLEKKLG